MRWLARYLASVGHHSTTQQLSILSKTAAYRAIGLPGATISSIYLPKKTTPVLHRRSHRKIRGPSSS